MADRRSAAGSVLMKPDSSRRDPSRPDPIERAHLKEPGDYVARHVPVPADPGVRRSAAALLDPRLVGAAGPGGAAAGPAVPGVARRRRGRLRPLLRRRLGAVHHDPDRKRLGGRRHVRAGRGGAARRRPDERLHGPVRRRGRRPRRGGEAPDRAGPGRHDTRSARPGRARRGHGVVPRRAAPLPARRRRRAAGQPGRRLRRGRSRGRPGGPGVRDASRCPSGRCSGWCTAGSG